MDLREAVNGSLAAEVEAAMDRYAVLVFRDQKLDESAQMAFTRTLGSIDMGLLKVLQTKSRFKEVGMIDISNVDLESQIRDRDDPKLVAMLANQLWHSDSSFKQPAAKYSLLMAQVVTEHGGETEFADMRAAYDALSQDTVAEIEDLIAEHSAFHFLHPASHFPLSTFHFPLFTFHFRFMCSLSRSTLHERAAM